MTLGPQFEQLKMFMTPADIKGYVTTSGDLHPGEDMPALWDRKLSQSKGPRDSGHGSGVYRGLREGKNLITRFGDVVDIHHDKGGRFLTDKHHRIAAQADLDEKAGKETYLPVSHYSDRMRAPEHKWQKKEGPPKPQSTSERKQADSIIKHFE